ncbi:MAG: Gfo/Idh/MocA family oxidoreductase, partial [Candidatus Saccharimonadaceae bacterium]|nr:Gfo/Idh/MocA family oxidoreductase [Candidatus Saccharimonadaceae bacterium]
SSANRRPITAGSTKILPSSRPNAASLLRERTGSRSYMKEEIRMLRSVVRMAIVGAGTWGENHARIYQAHPMAEPVAICDQNMAKAQALAERLGIAEVYQDYQVMLRQCDCDAVAIVTPDFAHAEIAVAAARAGKHVLIEKPLATTREDVLTLTEELAKSGVRAMVDLHNRWSPPFNQAWQAVQNGELGTLYSAYFRLNDIKWVATDLLPWAARSSILWFLGSHSLDTLRWMFGSDVKRVYAVSRQGLLKEAGVDTIDIYQSTLEFAGGGIAQMENGWITPNGNPNVNDMKCTLLGTRGMISIDTTHHNLIQHVSEDRLRVPDVLVQNHVFGEPKGFAFESIRGFIDRLVDGKPFTQGIMDILSPDICIYFIISFLLNSEIVII